MPGQTAPSRGLPCAEGVAQTAVSPEVFKTMGHEWGEEGAKRQAVAITADSIIPIGRRNTRKAPADAPVDDSDREPAPAAA